MSLPCFCRYKDARTLQALEGTLPLRKHGSTVGRRAAATGRAQHARPHRRSLGQRLLRPRLHMAERAAVAAAETQGLSWDKGLGSTTTTNTTPSSTSGAVQCLAGGAESYSRDWQLKDEDFFGRGIPPSSTAWSGSRPSAAQGRPGPYAARARQPVGKRKRDLDAYMQGLSRSPSAPLRPATKQQRSRKQSVRV